MLGTDAGVVQARTCIPVRQALHLAQSPSSWRKYVRVPCNTPGRTASERSSYLRGLSPSASAPINGHALVLSEGAGTMPIALRAAAHARARTASGKSAHH